MIPGSLTVEEIDYAIQHSVWSLEYFLGLYMTLGCEEMVNMYDRFNVLKCPVEACQHQSFCLINYSCMVYLIPYSVLI